MNNPFLARFDGEAVLINSDAQSRFTANLNAVMGHELATQAQISAYASGGEFWTELGSYSAQLRPYAVRDGILQIPVKGALMKDFPYQFFDHATGYEYIRMAFDRGLADPDVKGIALIFDTPGGMVAGNFDLVDHIYANRGIKPIAGFAQEHAYSAGYSLISAVDQGRINVSRTGGVGSIGVVTSHVDMSGAMEQRGMKITFIHAGQHKVDGNPYSALSVEAKNRIQARIDGLYAIFVSAVARNRGMDESAIRATEALTFSAEEAVSLGLADNIGSLEDAIVAFATSLSKMENETMFNQEQMDAAVETAKASAKAEGREEALAEGRADGVKAERARISAIVGSEAGAARPKAATKMALNEKFAALDADAIIELLADMPEEKAEAPAAAPKGAEGASTDFVKAMDNAQHPNLGAQAGGQVDPASARAAAALGAIGVSY